MDGRFSFIVTDCIESVAVDYIGTDFPPDLFSEGQGTIATGKMFGERFQATNLLAKHDETYQPKEVTEALQAEGACQHPEG